MAKRPICKIDGCDKPTHAKGFCNTHYTQHRVAVAALCKVEGCSGKSRSLGLCDHHYKVSRGVIREAREKPAGLAFLEALLEGDDRACIFWPFGKNGAGYGIVTYEGRQQVASRVVCILAHGHPEDESLHAAHSCGNGHLGCVNPKHVRWATCAENLADREMHGTHIKGERHPLAKLCNADVVEIRAARDAGETCRSIADRYKISSSMVSMIHQRKSWASL